MGVIGCIIDFMIRADTIQITPEILGLIAKIDEFKGAWRALDVIAARSPVRLAPRRDDREHRLFDAHRGKQAVRSEVERLLSNLDIKPFTTRDEEEVAGYARGHGPVFSPRGSDIDVTENHIHQLHRDLLRYSEKDRDTRGNRRPNQNSSPLSTRTGGKLAWYLRPPTPLTRRAALTELVTGATPQRGSRSASPAADRTCGSWSFSRFIRSRTATGVSAGVDHFAAFKRGLRLCSVLSLESVIEQSKEAYYLALRQTQGTIRPTRRTGGPGWCFFYGRWPSRCGALTRRSSARSWCSRRCRSCRCRSSNSPANTAESTMGDVIRLTGASRNTLKQHFRALVEQAHLNRHGRGRGVWYEL